MIGFVSGLGQDAAMVLSVNFHFLKGTMGQESYPQEVILHSSVSDFGLGIGPLIQFLALAFTDNVFEDNITPLILFDMEHRLNGRNATKTRTWLRWGPFTDND